MDSTYTGNAGYDDNSEIQPTCGPDWDTIEVNCSGVDFIKAAEELTMDETERCLVFIRGIIAWIDNNGSTNSDGLAIRARIIAWLTLPHYRPLTLTQLAKSHGGKHKQSYGRFVDDFKAKFPTVRTTHMNCE